MGKDLWFEEFDRIYNECLDQGVPAERAYNMAADMADGATVDRMADMIDLARMRRRDGAE